MYGAYGYHTNVAVHAAVLIRFHFSSKILRSSINLFLIFLRQFLSNNPFQNISTDVRYIYHLSCSQTCDHVFQDTCLYDQPSVEQCTNLYNDIHATRGLYNDNRQHKVGS
eukprot:GHVQ01025097.1.p1 GENE.GHVQ01025097.1~~GHVQ01025097.1.p1  ORF type:complete len:110 (+),score=1.15 GHVQ01025097.1:1100-1429(+)